MNNIIKEIDNAKGYFIDTNGNVWSNRRGKMKKLSPYVDSKDRYMYIKIKYNNQDTYTHKSIHRLVAEAFVNNPFNFPLVHHIDNNPQNNNAENLKWVTVAENVRETYFELPPTRNYVKCRLLKCGEDVGKFIGISTAAKYANEKYGASISSLKKYLKCKDIVIEPI